MNFINHWVITRLNRRSINIGKYLGKLISTFVKKLIQVCRNLGCHQFFVDQLSYSQQGGRFCLPYYYRLSSRNFSPSGSGLFCSRNGTVENELRLPRFLMKCSDDSEFQSPWAVLQSYRPLRQIINFGYFCRNYVAFIRQYDYNWFKFRLLAAEWFFSRCGEISKCCKLM